MHQTTELQNMWSKTDTLKEEIDQSTIIVNFSTLTSQKVIENWTENWQDCKRSLHHYKPKGSIDLYRILHLPTADYTLFL